MKTAETGSQARGCAALPDWLHSKLTEARGALRAPADPEHPGPGFDPTGGALADKLYAAAVRLDADGFARLCKGVASQPLREAVLRQVISRIEAGWQDDRLGIIEASNVFWTLERALRRGQNAAARRGDDREGAAPPHPMRVLLHVPDGEDHSFGAQLLYDQMRARGLRVQLKLREPKASVYEALEVQAVDMLAISLGYDHSLLGLPQLIHEARIVSSNPKLAVALGGQVFSGPAVDYDFLNADLIVRPDADPVAQLLRFLQEKTLVDGLHDG